MAMRFTDYLVTAQTNLLRTRVRTFLTVFAFVIGTFTLAMVTAFSQGLRSYLNTQLTAYGQPNVISVSMATTKQQTTASGIPYYLPNHQATNSGGGRDGSTAYTLNQSDLTKVKDTAGVTAAYPNSDLTIDYIQCQQSPKLIIQAQSAYPGETTDLAAGNFPMASQPTALVVPFAYVSAFGFSTPTQLLGKSVSLQVSNPLSGQSKQYTAVVSGVLPDTVHQPAAYLSYQMVNDMVQFQAGSTKQFSSIIAVAPSGVTKAERATIKANLQAKGYSAETYDDVLSNFSRPLTIITAGLTGFAAIALLAATIGIVNTLLMAVLERTQEIGLLKALGMRKRGITFIYLVEAASIGFWGGVIGVGLAFLCGLGLNPILTRTLFKGIGSTHILTYPLPYIAAIVAGAMLIGLLAGTLPAIRAGRLDPIEALRRE